MELVARGAKHVIRGLELSAASPSLTSDFWEAVKLKVGFITSG
jgi:hypothetical protein